MERTGPLKNKGAEAAYLKDEWFYGEINGKSLSCVL